MCSGTDLRFRSAEVAGRKKLLGGAELTFQDVPLLQLLRCRSLTQPPAGKENETCGC